MSTEANKDTKATNNAVSRHTMRLIYDLVIDGILNGDLKVELVDEWRFDNAMELFMTNIPGEQPARVYLYLFRGGKEATRRLKMRVVTSIGEVEGDSIANDYVDILARSVLEPMAPMEAELVKLANRLVYPPDASEDSYHTQAEIKPNAATPVQSADADVAVDNTTKELQKHEANTTRRTLSKAEAGVEARCCTAGHRNTYKII